MTINGTSQANQIIDTHPLLKERLEHAMFAETCHAEVLSVFGTAQLHVRCKAGGPGVSVPMDRLSDAAAIDGFMRDLADTLK